MNKTLQDTRDAVNHAIDAITNSPVLSDPFPHIYVPGIFPDNFYQQLLRELPTQDDYERLVDSGRVGPDYSRARLVLMPESYNIRNLPEHKRVLWEALFSSLLSEPFAAAVMTKFDAAIFQRLNEDSPGQDYNLQIEWESFLVRDSGTYALGPHTDALHKLVSMLFYLPADDSQKHLGTSLYAPMDDKFHCPGGPHHPFGKFLRVKTMAYQPNTLFAFPKTRDCFHGVEPVAAGAQRDLLFYDLRMGKNQ